MHLDQLRLDRGNIFIILIYIQNVYNISIFIYTFDYRCFKNSFFWYFEICHYIITFLYRKINSVLCLFFIIIHKWVFFLLPNNRQKSYDINNPGKKVDTRHATGVLKAWLREHRKSPYPSKQEKIMFTQITKMTMTQVCTWFANARRRMKKENSEEGGSSDNNSDSAGSGDEDDDGDGEDSRTDTSSQDSRKSIPSEWSTTFHYCF